MFWKCLRIKFVLPFIFVMGCASDDKRPQIDPATGLANSREAKMARAFEKASRLLDDGYYDKASKQLDALRVESPVSTLDGMVLYNSGIAHYKAGRCDLATQRFRAALRYSKNRVKGLEVRSKLRLTETYACLGDRKKTLLTLLEVYRDRLHLPPEIGEAEVPARIAAAYAQNGNRRQANRFFKKAERGLQLVERKNQSSRQFKSRMAKTLYMMGNMNTVHAESMESKPYFNAVKSLQRYLFRAVKSEEKPWSAQAREQILSAYETTWSFINRSESATSSDDTIELREGRRNRAKIVMNAIDALAALKREVIPKESKKQSVIDLFDGLAKEERKMRNYLATVAPGTELTKEAQKLLGTKREGKVRSRETVLERKARQRMPEKRKRK